MQANALLTPGLLALACAACGSEATNPSAGRPNVLFISVDTLRADHLGTYGYERGTSPELDRLAAESVVFEHAVASASWTLPSFASIMTSQLTETHRCWDVSSRLDSSFPTLAEILLVHGYETACFVSHVALSRKYGLQQGFVHYDDQADYPAVRSDAAISSPEVSARAIEWLEQRAGRADETPWFLWLHYFDPHGDYLTHAGLPAELGQLDQADEVARYDGEIHFTDQHVGRVLDALRTSGLDDETIVVFHSDHGEEFGDHGGSKHGHSLHREVLRVPLFIRAPGIEPGRIGGVVRTVDILPTLLELVGLPEPLDIAGVSLVPSLQGQPLPELAALAQVRLYSPSHFDGIVRGRWKLVRDLADDSLVLFDIVADPEETTDVADAEPEVVAELELLMAELIATSKLRAERYDQALDLDLTGGDIDRLRDLGYIGDDQ